MVTVKDIWTRSTCDIFLDRGEGAEPLKLPTGGRLQIEHAELLLVSMIIRTRASESPYMLLKTAAPE